MKTDWLLWLSVALLQFVFAVLLYSEIQLANRVAALEEKAHDSGKNGWVKIGGEGEGEGEGEVGLLSFPKAPHKFVIGPIRDCEYYNAMEFYLPLPDGFETTYRWTLPPLDTTGMSVTEKCLKLHERDAWCGHMNRFNLKPLKWTSAKSPLQLFSENPINVIRLGGNNEVGMVDPEFRFPDELVDQLRPIIESYVAARRAQVDALRKEIAK